MSRIMQRSASVVVALVTVLAVALAGTPAHAAALDRSPAPPGAGYVWGVAPADLPACSTSPDYPDRGGWSGRRIISSAGEYVNHDLIAPLLATWSEPCYDSSGTSGARRVQVPFKIYSMPVAAQPFSAHSTLSVPLDAQTVAGQSVRAHLVCAGAEWSTTQTTIYNRFATGGGTGGLNQTLIPGGGEMALDRLSWDSGSSCARLVRALIVVCVWNVRAPEVGPHNFRKDCNTFVWSADAWYNQSQHYSTDSLDKQLCDLGAYSSDCRQYNAPSEWDWESACAYPPGYGSGPPPATGWDAAWSWIFTDWFPYVWELVNALIGHYAECTFVPPGGWDSQGLIESAWNSSSFSNVNALLEDAGNAITLTETCGVLLNMPEMLGSEPVDTCTWASWAGPVKTFITWTGWMFFGYWALTFFIQTMLAAVRAAPMPNPLVSDVAEVRATEDIGR